MEFQIFKTLFRHIDKFRIQNSEFRICYRSSYIVYRISFITLLFTVYCLQFTVSAQCFGDQVQVAYNNRNAREVRRLMNAATNQSDKFLAIYRLYPLTEDGTILANLPADPNRENAKDKALLSALWSYKINEDRSLMMTLGTRIIRLLNSSERLNAQNPFVLLIVGQSLLYKPAVFGGSAARALQKFQALKRQIQAEAICGLSIWDADVWIWYAMHKKRDRGAEAFKQELYRNNPPVIYREFLNNPPE
jgi:stage V sporulation protein SpoVS